MTRKQLIKDLFGELVSASGFDLTLQFKDNLYQIEHIDSHAFMPWRTSKEAEQYLRGMIRGIITYKYMNDGSKKGS